jgi:hypothetical protein
MSRIRRVLVRSLVTLAIAGLGLALPATASADFLDFTVDEGAVGAPTFPLVLTADILNGGYEETITFGAGGAFTASAVADFTAFRANEGSVGVFSQLDDPNCVSTATVLCSALPTYAIYAVFTSTGFAAPGADPNTTVFTGTGAEVSLYLDRNQDTTKTAAAGATGNTGDDSLILSSSNLIEGGGRLVPPGSEGFPLGGGTFSLVFGDLLLSPFGQLYFPSMATLDLTAIASGDFNFFQPVGTQTVTGDLSVGFEGAAVPEPLTLSLFGMTLLGTGIVARRRRNAAVR